MGVIRKTDHKIGKFQAVSEESLGIPHTSDEESIIEDNLLLRPDQFVNQNHNDRRFRPIPTTFSSGRKRLGRKKRRRFENVLALSSLIEEDEFEEVSMQDLAPSDGSSFSRLLEDNTAMKTWNDFINSSEEVQNKIISKASSKKCPKSVNIAHTGDEAFKNIHGGIRAVLKRRIPLAMLHHLETEVLTFFSDTPSQVYISGDTTSFERLMLHALSQYHLLVSQSFNTTGSRLVRIIQPKDLANSWKACPVLMSDHLKHRFETRDMH